ncbi:MAG: beta-galactosidase [Armatimonadota bacterium]|nr:beta-galactosidase [Armatimonadota bacterium]
MAGVSAQTGKPAGQNVLPNGNFEMLDANGRPTGWDTPRRNSRVVEENGNHYMVISKVTGEELPWLGLTVPLDPAWGRLRLSAKMRVRDLKLGAEGWQNARVGLRWEDAEGKLVGYPSMLEIKADTAWATLSSEFDVPAEAKRLAINPGIYGPAGELSIDDIQLVVLPKAAAPATTNTAATASNAPKDATLPPNERITWHQEPVEKTSAMRGTVVLNGLWKFQPAVSGAKEPAPVGWGYMRVPGSWRTGYSPISIPQMVAPGSGPGWDAWKNDTLLQGWYERPLRVPADWQGRAIILNLTRVSTDAWLYVDGKEAGRVTWPAGEVDITRFVTPGREHQLRVYVAAIQTEKEVGNFMGPGAGQMTMQTATLESKGLIDDVLLESRPLGAHVSDVFVQPSTRKKQIALDVELTGVTQPMPLRLTARMERNGRIEKTFTQTVNAKAAPLQTLQLTWPWAEAALWDLDQPNLYTVKLQVEGAGMADEYAQEFGFREFWVEGRTIFLNGTPIRLRPQTVPQEWSPISGTSEYIEPALKGLRANGFNIGEMWPGGAQRRGQHHFQHVYYDTADKLGFPLMGSAGNIGDFIGWGKGNWNSPEAKAEWERLTRQELRRHRNHPSVVMWASSGNNFGHGHDQNPLAIGRSMEESGLKWSDEQWKRARSIQGALDTMKQMDPTRPSFIHQGVIGDIWAVNSYLNFMPLQEDEEWLSAWARSGTKPYLPIEFGAPFPTSFMRGREHFGQAEESEPWMSEFAAIYLGPEAYRIETPEYREAMREKFQSGQKYASWHNEGSRDYSPTHMTILPMFTERIWRGWRGMGTTAGMVPWSGGYAWVHSGPNEEVDAPPFQPGRRGTYSPKLRKALLFANQPQAGNSLTAAGKALIANNRETLAFIGGKIVANDDASFTDKQHAFWSGAPVEKSVVLINDYRTPQPYSFAWQAKAGGKVIASGQKSGAIGVAQNLFMPFTFKAPIVTSKSDGVIEMNAKIGPRSHSDSFAFRVWPRSANEQGSVAVFDPQGRTTRMLNTLGLRTVPWNGGATGQLLVIGREALSSGAKLPGDVAAFARSGGRVLVMQQNAEWMEQRWGFRVSRHVSRYVFPVSAAHPVVNGLDAEDLRDWAGSSNARGPHTPIPDKNEEAPYGWHWGNRGGVASASLEEPHLAGWRPILQGEFDLAYSPLMELDLGAGRVTLCMLDLEERFAANAPALEPAADRLARQTVRYAQTAPLSPRVDQVALIGTAPKWLDMLGVRYEKAASLPNNAAGVLIGADANVDEGALNAYLQNGGKAVFLPRQTANAPLGVTLAQKASTGSLEAPNWKVAQGLSASDLRWRNEANAWLVQGGEGVQVGADGQLAMKPVGKGLAVWLQLDPERFNADEKTYFRFTRWRQMRAVAQVLSNLGLALRDDAQALRTTPMEPAVMPLAGTWQATVTVDLPAAANPGDLKDPGISEAAKALLDGSKAITESMQVPGGVPGLVNRDGEAVMRREINIPTSWAGKDLRLELGRVDDFDITFWNGEKIGAIGPENSQAWNTNRDYKVPGHLVKAGRNVIAVRIWDWFGGGGFNSLAADMTLRPDEGAAPFMYHPDYRTDFILGDDPFRYKRW